MAGLLSQTMLITSEELVVDVKDYYLKQWLATRTVPYKWLSEVMQNNTRLAMVKLTRNLKNCSLQVVE